MNEQLSSNEVTTEPTSLFSRILWRAGIVFSILFVAIGYGLGIVFPPRPPIGTFVEVKKGMNAQEIGNVLKEDGVVRSSTLFVWAVHIAGLERRLGAGRFHFTTPLSTPEVVGKLVAGNREITILIPEGYTETQVRDVLIGSGVVDQQELEDALKKDYTKDFSFLVGTRGLEGYLFPDTYRFFEFSKGEDVVRAIIKNFDSKTAKLQAEIAASNRPLNDLVIMASILEREAQKDDDMKMVAGILWHRFDKGMPLQVDATQMYVPIDPLNVNEFDNDRTKSDPMIANPYDTYARSGLPFTAIANPGLRALDAALHPTPSQYLFYLSDKDGVIYYARTFEEHKRNKAKYLK